MSEPASQDLWGDLAHELDADVRRVADRLRNLSLARLAGQAGQAAQAAQPEPGRTSYGSRADAARGVARTLAATALSLEAAARGERPQRREVPALADHAVGDQVAVTGHDLLAAIRLVDPDTEVELDAGERVPARQAVERAARMLADLRRSL